MMMLSYTFPPRGELEKQVGGRPRRKRLLVCAWNAETRRKQPPFGREAAECDRGPQKVGLSCGEWFQTRC